MVVGNESTLGKPRNLKDAHCLRSDRSSRVEYLERSLFLGHT